MRDMALHCTGFEEVFAVTDYDEGRRRGIGNHHGQPRDEERCCLAPIE
jgi:hypothetical protein